ncbi:winged helix-turn-helix domain-containing protein [Cognatilysobacter tabacisoli]|uniref:winged helix-turn-helix domain-containing protein n=1 Tax=Cognatilysobacter tabacisoli TaxID=2315424 RepID=UPI000E6AFEEA|nr:winged helix-turn-helix domain-containing protein [Lysobacter tabacisoli]
MGPTGTTGQGGPHPEIHQFGDVVIDAGAHTLTRAGEPQTVEPKAFAVLLLLVERSGQMVPRDELLDAVWGHRHVTPGVLTRVIAQLRHALGDDSHQPRYIQTHHALGYRFIGAQNGAAPAATPGLDGTAASAADHHDEDAPSASPADAGVPAEPIHAPAAAADTGAPADSPASDWPGDRRMHGANGHGHGGRRAGDHLLRRGWWIALAAGVIALAAAGWWLRGRDAPPPLEPSIAVLPFTTLSDDRQDRYFAEGLAAEMHAALAGVHGLKVAAWVPPGALVDGEDAKALGKRLGVATVLDASVRRAGARVRISARLSDTRSGYTLWSRTYDRELTDVFATQSDIAGEVATALVGAMPDAGEGLRRRLRPTRDVAAFDAYLRGLHAWAQPSGADRDGRALGYFNQAIAIDTGFARAQAGICRVELWRFENNRDASAFERARLACLRAENMDPSMREVVLALGDLHRVKGELDAAEARYRALENEPGMRGKALVGLARVAAKRGRDDEARRLFDAAVAASPSDSYIHADRGYQAYVSGRLPEAIAAYRRATELLPTNAYHWATYGGLLLSAGRNDEAAAAFERSMAIEPLESVLSNLGTLRYQQRDYAGAAKYYREATALNPGHFQVWGNLGDALLADPATAPQARAAFAEAARLAEPFVAMQPDDAKAVAALGWYRANLGDARAAMAAVQRAEAIGAERAEVAYYNAATLAALGRRDAAAERVAAALEAGLPQARIATNPLLARLGAPAAPAVTQ